MVPLLIPPPHRTGGGGGSLWGSEVESELCVSTLMPGRTSQDYMQTPGSHMQRW